MVKRRGKGGDGATIATGGLLRLLRHCHLGGVLEEFVLNVEDGKGTVEAVDMTNSLIVISRQRVMGKGTDATLGLGNIDLLIRFLSSMEEEKALAMKITANKLSITRGKGTRQLKYLLTQADLIGTRLVLDEDEEENPYDKFDSMMQYAVTLGEDFIKDFLSYIGILATKDVVLKYDGGMRFQVTFVCGGAEDHQAELVLQSEVEGGEDEDEEFELQLNGEHLARIFNVIEYDEAEPPILKFAEDKPMMINIDNTTWALMPITKEEEGE